MFAFLLDLLVYTLPILLVVAFLTLLERKILAFSQNRLGPNKVGMSGLFQPFSDAIKLFTKQMEFPINSNVFLFFISPVFMFLVSLNLIFCPPHDLLKNNLSLSAVYFIFLLSINVYPMFILGWSSNNKYAMIGGIRSVAQTISYEISLALIIMLFMTAFLSLKLKAFSNNLSILESQFCFWNLWITTMLAESNRTPFDFSEGESELVSGFNIEYSSTNFVLIFLAEYTSIFFFSCVTTYCLFGLPLKSLPGMMMSLFVLLVWIDLRATLVRLRYDGLMKFAWKSLLPISLTLWMVLVAMNNIILYLTKEFWTLNL